VRNIAHSQVSISSSVSCVEWNPKSPSNLTSGSSLIDFLNSSDNSISPTLLAVGTIAGTVSLIDWKNVDSSIYNLRFREDPGVDNALGRFKFKFDNNCGIYLHDSLAQSAFDESNRGLSHGCIRIAEVDSFANFLIKTNNGWDSSRLANEVNSNKHQFVKLSRPTALSVIYLTAWYDADEDFVQFRDDIYSYDKLSLYPLYLSDQN
jgi:murein L,D-transpeptidase YcbB/YkuD